MLTVLLTLSLSLCAPLSPGDALCVNSADRVRVLLDAFGEKVQRKTRCSECARETVRIWVDWIETPDQPPSSLLSISRVSVTSLWLTVFFVGLAFSPPSCFLSSIFLSLPGSRAVPHLLSPLLSQTRLSVLDFHPSSVFQDECLDVWIFCAVSLLLFALCSNSTFMLSCVFVRYCCFSSSMVHCSLRSLALCSLFPHTHSLCSAGK